MTITQTLILPLFRPHLPPSPTQTRKPTPKPSTPAFSPASSAPTPSSSHGHPCPTTPSSSSPWPRSLPGSPPTLSSTASTSTSATSDPPSTSPRPWPRWSSSPHRRSHPSHSRSSGEREHLSEAWPPEASPASSLSPFSPATLHSRPFYPGSSRSSPLLASTLPLRGYTSPLPRSSRCIWSASAWESASRRRESVGL